MNDLWPLLTLKCPECFADVELVDDIIRCDCGYSEDPDQHEPPDEEARARLLETHYG